MHIDHKNVPVNPEKMTAEIDASKNALILICKGQAVMYPVPEFGTIEIGFQHYKGQRPQYKIVAD